MCLKTIGNPFDIERFLNISSFVLHRRTKVNDMRVSKRWRDMRRVFLFQYPFKNLVWSLFTFSENSSCRKLFKGYFTPKPASKYFTVCHIKYYPAMFSHSSWKLHFSISYVNTICSSVIITKGKITRQKKHHYHWKPCIFKHFQKWNYFN